MVAVSKQQMNLFFDIESHNGTITVENPATGGHRTFRIRTQKPDARFAPGERILSIRTANGWQQIAFVKPGRRIVLWRKYQTGSWKRLVDVVARPQHFEELGVKYLYEGKCRVCNRPLTHPESIESGLGPICAGRR